MIYILGDVTQKILYRHCVYVLRTYCHQAVTVDAYPPALSLWLITPTPSTLNWNVVATVDKL